MGELWLLLAWAGLLMVAWMFIVWIWQRKRLIGGMEQFGWSAGLAWVAILFAVEGTGYGPRRLLMALMMILSGGFLARRSWLLGQEAESAGFKRLFFFECRALQALILSLPAALLAVDPLPAITGYEWVGLLLWGTGMAGQVLAESTAALGEPRPRRAATFGWLVWVGFFVAALATPYGAWTIVCPLIMLPSLLRSAPPVGDDEVTPAS